MKTIRDLCRIIGLGMLLFILACTVGAMTGCDDSSLVHDVPLIEHQ